MKTPQANREIDISRARPRRPLPDGGRPSRPVSPADARERSAAPMAQGGGQRTPAHAVPRRAARQTGEALAGEPLPNRRAPRADAQPIPFAAQDHAAARPEHTAARPAAGTGPQRRRNVWARRVGVGALCVVLTITLLAGGAYLYVDSLIRESDFGSVDGAPSASAVQADAPEKTDIVPPDFAGVRNILVLGLDYESEGPVVRDEKHPNTDMILYVRLDGNAHTARMLQFPRDIFVAEAGGSAGKINGILAANVDGGNGLGALKNYIESNFGLPIDDYITIDMDALVEMVDAFDGVEVYVPQDMRYYNTKTGALEGELLQGWRKLRGKECEYFLRYRQGLVRGDLDRLVMQRLFYAALFRRLKEAAVVDIVKLLPVAQQYIRTDIATLDLMSIAIELSRMPGASISIGRVPVYGTNQRYYGGLEEGTLPVVLAKEETAALLNEYFRPADAPISASDLGTPEWPTTGGAAGAEMSTMGDVEAVGADAPRA